MLYVPASSLDPADLPPEQTHALSTAVSHGIVKWSRTFPGGQLTVLTSLAPLCPPRSSSFSSSAPGTSSSFFFFFTGWHVTHIQACYTLPSTDDLLLFVLYKTKIKNFGFHIFIFGNRQYWGYTERDSDFLRVTVAVPGHLWGASLLYKIKNMQIKH